jgi:hypothetical protein
MWPVRKADSLTTVCEQIVQKMWEPRHLTTLWASTACYIDRFTSSFYITRWTCIHCFRTSPCRAYEHMCRALEALTTVRFIRLTSLCESHIQAYRSITLAGNCWNWSKSLYVYWIPLQMTETFEIRSIKGDEEADKTLTYTVNSFWRYLCKLNAVQVQQSLNTISFWHVRPFQWIVKVRKLCTINCFVTYY